MHMYVIVTCMVSVVTRSRACIRWSHRLGSYTLLIFCGCAIVAIGHTRCRHKALSMAEMAQRPLYYHRFHLMR